MRHDAAISIFSSPATHSFLLFGKATAHDKGTTKSRRCAISYFGPICHMQDVHFEPRFQTLYDREKIAYSPAHAGTSPGHACEETYAVSPPFLTSD